MKLSLNWVKEFIDFELPAVDELLEKIGSQLGAIEDVIDFGAKYQGVVIVKVVKCTKLADTDHLSHCLVDDGGVVKNVERDKDGLVQVVCGAPNVREGLLVAWLPPGSTVPSSYGTADPFVLQAKELRGVVSNGMLASAKELAFGDNHQGLLIVDEKCSPGDSFAEVYKLDDHIINIENKMFTHRPDCFGLLGVSREIAGIQGKAFVSPDWYTSKPSLSSHPKLDLGSNQKDIAEGDAKSTGFPIVAGDDKPLKLKFDNQLPELSKRFVLIPMSDVSVKSSPVWLQSILTRHGIRPINNVVDVTNYYMLLTGQPLHAYDYDKVKALSGSDGASLVVRNPRPGEKLTLLNGKTVEPSAETIMIATDKHLIGIGGVMGGADTEVDDSTKNILLESASFDMYSIRRVSMTQGLFTDAVTRFNKGQSPLQNLAVALKAASELTDLSGAQLAGQLIDDNHLEDSVLGRQSLHPPVEITAEFINARLGLELSPADIRTLLQNVEFDVEVKDDELSITAPFWRTDIELREDVVEEVGRLYGYDKLPLALPQRDLTPAPEDELLRLKATIRGRLSQAGANEVLTYSFVHGNLLDKTGQDKNQAYQLSNALSPDLQYYRISLLPSLLDKVHPNIKAGYDEFALFELGKTHSLEQPADSEGLPSEYDITALVVAANDKLKKSGTAYYQARKFLTNLAGYQLVFSPITDDMKKFSMTSPYDANRSAMVSTKDGTFLGIIGEFKASVARQLKLPKYCAGFEVDTAVLGAAMEQVSRYVALPKFPKITQDITLKVPAELSYQDLYDFVGDELAKIQPEHTLPMLGPVDIFQKSDDAEHKQISLRLSLASYDRTLTDKEVNTLLDKVAEAAKAKFSADRI